MLSKGHELKWESPEKLHLTLKFLGDVDTDLIEEIDGNIRNALEKFECVSSYFNKFGVFKKFKKPRVLWLGIKRSDQLESLHELIDNSMSAVGFERENRRFTPHLTLLRIKKDIEPKLLKNFLDYNLEPILFESCQVSLIKSELKPEGSSYTLLRKFKLLE
jgi:2'-5' RNA ligase